MITRRQLLVAGSVGGASMLLPAGISWAASKRLAPPPLDPNTIPKYVADLLIPPAMPPTYAGGEHGVDEYLIGVRQFQQQVLLPSLPKTTVWGYGSTAQGNAFNYPSFTINALVGRPVRVTWINQLVDQQGRFLPHLLPVDPTLDWVNPPGGIAGRDSMPTFTSTPGPYTGPVPMVVHLHSGNSTEDHTLGVTRQNTTTSVTPSGSMAWWCADDTSTWRSWCESCARSRWPPPLAVGMLIPMVVEDRNDARRPKGVRGQPCSQPAHPE
jgi:hypothetical protein